MIDSGLNMNMKEAFAQDKDGGVLDYCRLNDITIQPWSSIQASWAEGTFIDHPNYQKLNDVMQQLAHKYQVTKPAIAIAWLLRHPAHMQPIVGTTSSQHLKETIKHVILRLQDKNGMISILQVINHYHKSINEAFFYCFFHDKIKEEMRW